MQQTYLVAAWIDEHPAVQPPAIDGLEEDFVVFEGNDVEQIFCFTSLNLRMKQLAVVEHRRDSRRDANPQNEKCSNSAAQHLCPAPAEDKFTHDSRFSVNKIAPPKAEPCSVLSLQESAHKANQISNAANHDKRIA